jgi:D-alanyl-D-alanine carboxypeptidase (penicillin-binding protein 5/6)
LFQYRLISVYKLILCLFILILLWPAPKAEALFSASSGGSIPALAVSYAAAAVLIEANSGEVLYADNADTSLPPASTTKVLTALLALDMGADMDKPRIISEEAAAVGDMSMNLAAGESLTLTDLLKGALVHSGNDACYAISEIVAGSESLFVHWMNMKAAVLGAYSVHMDNTNGLPCTTHQMSATDLALLCRYAMANDFFAETVSSKYITLGEGASARTYQNTNKLLWQDPHIVGIKTGTTDAAGPCLAAAYADGAALFISVVFDSANRYGESFSLLNYGADNYLLVYLPCSGQVLAYYPQAQNGVFLTAASDLLVLVTEEISRNMSWVWRLSPSGGSLHLEDGQKRDLGGITLVAQETMP